MNRKYLIFKKICLTNDLKRFMNSKVNRLRSANFFDVKSLLKSDHLDSKQLKLRGWVNSTVKSMKKLTFFHLNDGLSNANIQVVMTKDQENSLKHNLIYGSSIICTGVLKKSIGKKQSLEFKCDQIESVGENILFPFHNKEQSDNWDNIRQHPHLRFKSKHFASLQRLRSRLLVSMHDYLQNRGYINICTPIITTNDCEGGGETFTLSIKPKANELKVNKTMENSNSISTKESMKNEASKILWKENDLQKNELKKSKYVVDDYVKSNLEEYNMSSKEILKNFILTKKFPKKSNEFFGRSTFLTVSGQLHLEAASLGVNRVYTLSSCFRSEGSVSRKHLSEFIMLEVEESFLDSLDILMDNVEMLCKDLAKNLLNECKEEIDLILKENGKEKFLDSIINNNYKRITYEDALKLINEQSELPKIEYGSNLNAKCERFLTDYFKNTPVFISHFPSYIKPFYMKTKFDKALNFDLIFPICGEVAGGSLREDEFDRMEKLFEIHNLKDLEWYKNLRKEGSLPHGGFGLGVDRFVQAILSMSNIRDVVPFPRWMHHCRL